MTTAGPPVRSDRRIAAALPRRVTDLLNGAFVKVTNGLLFFYAQK